MIPPPRAVAWRGAVWPVPIWKGERPVISDGFKLTAKKDPATGKQVSRQHLGVDIMFGNRSAQKPKVPTTTKWYHCSSDEVPMLAMLGGVVHLAKKTMTGFSVHIDHGARYGVPLVTYYTHMSRLLVKKGDVVEPGHPLGIIGNNPATANDPNHAHVELWDYSLGARPREERCVDLGPYLSVWAKLAVAATPAGGYRLG